MSLGFNSCMFLLHHFFSSSLLKETPRTGLSVPVYIFSSFDLPLLPTYWPSKSYLAIQKGEKRVPWGDNNAYWWRVDGTRGGGGKGGGGEERRG